MASHFSDSDASLRSPSEYSSANSTEFLDHHRHEEYIDHRHLKTIFENRVKALQSDKSRDQYIAFSSFPSDQLSTVHDILSPISKSFRISFNSRTKILIIKVMAYLTHELTAGTFNKFIIAELLSMNVYGEVDIFNATLITLGPWVKQPDCSWGPLSLKDQLTCVLEVGLSESRRRLAIDAHGWIETPGSSVQTAITISINSDKPEMIIEKWESHSARIATRASPKSARQTTTIIINQVNNSTSLTGHSIVNGRNVATSQLSLSFETFVGRRPSSPPERDLIISEPLLRFLAERIWALQFPQTFPMPTFPSQV